MENEFKDMNGLAKGLEVLLEHPKEFEKLIEALKIEDAKKYQAILEELRIYRYCKLICFWYYYWVWVKVCDWYCKDIKPVEVNFEKVQEYAKVCVSLFRDEKTLSSLVEAYRKQDRKMWEGLLQEKKLVPYCILICRWIRILARRRICKLVCYPIYY